jgi:DNA-binding HxlR family transcriptional regulator
VDDQPNVLRQSCESRQALELIADKWAILVMYSLAQGPKRHGELRRTIEGISQKMLTQTLRSLEADGIVQRTVYETVPPHVDYRLTDLGRTLETPMAAICTWAMGHIEELREARLASRTVPAQVVHSVYPSRL